MKQDIQDIYLILICNCVVGFALFSGLSFLSVNLTCQLSCFLEDLNIFAFKDPAQYLVEKKRNEDPSHVFLR